MDPQQQPSLLASGGAGGSRGQAPCCGADAGPASQGVVDEGSAQPADPCAPGGGLLRHLLGHRVHRDAAGAEGLGGGGSSGPRTHISKGEAPWERTEVQKSQDLRLGKGEVLGLGF